MCGIIAVFTSSRGRDYGRRIERALDGLNCRGPDERASWISPCGRVALGHTRLSVMDPVNAQQPIHCNGIHAVVNGEFYEFERIRRDLEQSGVGFQTNGDSEILVHLYQRYGISALDHLEGEFAFVLWDSVNQRLIAGRDRFGIKPLYYALRNHEIVFASEVKSMASLGEPLAWDEQTVGNLVSGLAQDARRSLFKDIYQVPPAHVMMLASTADISFHEYWNFDYRDTADLKEGSIDEAILRVRESLQKAVRRRLRADVEVGCYLSGGLDSSSIFGIASVELGRPIKPFCISFDHQDYDELKIAEATSRRYGADPIVLKIYEDDLADNFEAAIFHSEFVFFNTHGIAKFLLSRHVRDHGLKVVMTGEGADEIFAGYPHFRQDLILQCNSEIERNDLLAKLGDMNRATQGFTVALTDDTLDVLDHTIGMTPSFLKVQLQGRKHLNRFLSKDFRQSLGGVDSLERLYSAIDLRPLKNSHPVNKSMYLWSKTNFPTYVLNVLGDRMEMAHSIEARVPFLDRDLVELVQRLPVTYKIRNLSEKWILKEAAKPFITDEVYKRQKHPFTAPPALINTKGRLFEYMRETLNQDCPFFDMNKIRAALDGADQLPEKFRGSLDVALCQITSLVVLGKRFGL